VTDLNTLFSRKEEEGARVSRKHKPLRRRRFSHSGWRNSGASICYDPGYGASAVPAWRRLQSVAAFCLTWTRAAGRLPTIERILEERPMLEDEPPFLMIPQK